MELLSMDNWNVFLTTRRPETCQRDQLFVVLKTLPWVAVSTSFNIGLYTNPDHTDEDRKTALDGDL